MLCRPHRNPRTPGPHELCCAGPTGNGQRHPTPALVRLKGTQADCPPCRGGAAAGSKGNRGPAGPRTGGPSIQPPHPASVSHRSGHPPPRGGGGLQGNTHMWLLPPPCARTPPPSTPRRPPPPPPPLGRCRHTPGQRDAGRLLPCTLPRESVSGNFSRRHVLGAFTTTTTTTYQTAPRRASCRLQAMPKRALPPGTRTLGSQGCLRLSTA